MWIDTARGSLLLWTSVSRKAFFMTGLLEEMIDSVSRHSKNCHTPIAEILY